MVKYKVKTILIVLVLIIISQIMTLIKVKTLTDGLIGIILGIAGLILSGRGIDE